MPKNLKILKQLIKKIVVYKKRVKLRIYGKTHFSKRIKTLSDENSFKIQTNSFKSGIYFFTIKVNTFTETKKVIILR